MKAVRAARGKTIYGHTREAILEAAREVLARDGVEGLSVAKVVHLAGVSRAAAYKLFQSREQLIEATEEGVSERLHQAAFGEESAAAGVIDRLASIAMENPELGRVWLYELLNSRRPANDVFWQQYESEMARLTRSGSAQRGIDVEVHALVMLTATFLWPVWVHAYTRSPKERRRMTERFTREMTRLSLHGIVRPST